MRCTLLALGLTTGAFGLAACDRPADPPSAGPLPADTLPVFEGGGEFLDDGADDPSFSAFRDSLRRLVARQDTAALLEVVADDAKLSYDDVPGGPEGMRVLWFAPEASPPEPVWIVLDRILSAGSVEEDGAFTVPYVAGLWPETLDPSQHVAAVGDSTVVWNRPGGAEVARLSGVQILPLDDSTSADTWHVRLPDGTDGYIPRTSAVSPLGYRATFWQTGDTWKLHVFVSGD